MNKKFFIIAVLAVIAGFAAWGILYNPEPEQNLAQSESPEADDSAAAMTIKGMEIKQGENGVELWHLVAEGAVMSQQGGDIVAEKPFLTYYFYGDLADADNGTAIGSAPTTSGEAAKGPDAAKNERQLITVESDAGDVNQKDNRIRFVGNVQVKHELDLLKTSVILYEGPENTLTCPEPSVLIRPGVIGRAKTMQWDLNTNMLHASNGVTLDIETTRAAGDSLIPGLNQSNK
ncbi:LPS export ABC transporter periplasmic protein LptC [Desulfovibrio sp. OttesenSCG-928-F07]|nr:LPS export ABC transporter periplasmic protein LptC [Desulfovibrio sp. OttesenSCG-928-F07]